MSEQSETRKELRAKLREARREWPEAQRESAEKRVAQRLVEFTSLLQPGFVCTYSATDAELDLSQATDELRSSGWRIFLPVIGADREMKFAEWVASEQLKPNKFSILQPAAPTELLTAAQMDLVLVPCVGLDLAGNRLGFGAGFYDRALEDQGSKHNHGSTGPILIGCVFELQIVEQLLAEQWDIPMDYVLTEAKMTRAD